jgi:hypothetical protein
MKAKQEKKTFHIKAYKKKELIEVLGISSEYEFEKITKPNAEKVGKRIGHYYTPKQVGIILDLVRMDRHKKAESKSK